MFVDYNSGMYAVEGHRFGPEWIGAFAQYTRRKAGYYPTMSRKDRRVLEIRAFQEGIQQVDTYLNPHTGRCELKDWQRIRHQVGGRNYLVG